MLAAVSTILDWSFGLLTLLSDEAITMMTLRCVSYRESESIALILIGRRRGRTAVLKPRVQAININKHRCGVVNPVSIPYRPVWKSRFSSKLFTTSFVVKAEPKS